MAHGEVVEGQWGGKWEVLVSGLITKDSVERAAEQTPRVKAKGNFSPDLREDSSSRELLGDANRLQELSPQEELHWPQKCSVLYDSRQATSGQQGTSG